MRNHISSLSLHRDRAALPAPGNCKPPGCPEPPPWLAYLPCGDYLVSTWEALNAVK